MPIATKNINAEKIQGNLDITSVTSSFTGSYIGNGAGLYNIPAAGIVGLNLSQISSGSVSASIDPINGLRINTNVTAISFTGSFTGSYVGSGAGLYNIPASGITGLNLSQIASGSATASISPTAGLRINTNTTITGSLSNGFATKTIGLYSHAEGFDTTAKVDYSHAEGNFTFAEGYASHTEGESTVTFGTSSHAEGYANNAWETYSHAEGFSTETYGYASHAEGDGTKTYGTASHAEGNYTIASGSWSHAEGFLSKAYGNYSHAEGESTQTYGPKSHAEGNATITYGDYGHSEGEGTIALGYASHTEGYYTIASGSFQHVGGTYNKQGDSTSLFIIGNGTSNAARSDIFRVTNTDVQITGSLLVSAGITASLFGTASWALNSVTSSYAESAATSSYVLNAISSSFAATASYALNAGTTINTGSFVTTSSFNLYTGSAASQFAGTASYANFVNSASFAVTASYVNISAITLINPIVQYFDTTASIAAGTIVTLPGGLTFVSSSQFEYIEIFINGLRLRYDRDFLPISSASVQYQLSIPAGSEITYKSLYR